MIHLELTPDETEVLSEALESYLSDLRMEIADTNSQDFREMLKARKVVLNQMIAALQQDQPSPTAS